MSKAEELNEQLYERMAAEQKEFYEHLLTLPPKEILDKAYEYAVREDIVLTMENADLSINQCKGLLKLDKPLDHVFRKYQDRDTEYMDDLRLSVEGLADEMLRLERHAQEHSGR